MPIKGGIISNVKRDTPKNKNTKGETIMNSYNKVIGYRVHIGFTNRYFKHREEAEKFYFDQCEENYEDFTYEYETTKENHISPITWGELWDKDEDGNYYLDDADELRELF